MTNGHSVYFELMNAGNRLATVSVRRISTPAAIDSVPWAYEVRYADKAPRRGTVYAPDAIEELHLVHTVLQDYFATHRYGRVSS